MNCRKFVPYKGNCDEKKLRENFGSILRRKLSDTFFGETCVDFCGSSFPASHYLCTPPIIAMQIRLKIRYHFEKNTLKDCRI